VNYDSNHRRLVSLALTTDHACMQSAFTMLIFAKFEQPAKVVSDLAQMTACRTNWSLGAKIQHISTIQLKTD